MKIQETFESIARRLLFIQRRLWKEDSREEVRELSRLVDQLRDKVDNFYGPRIAREITYDKEEK